MSAGPAYNNLTIVRAEKSIYIKRYVCVFVCVSRFVCPPGDKHFFHTGEGGTNISCTQEGGGTNIFHTQGGDKHFCLGGGDKHFMLEALVAMMMLMKRWMCNVSEANIPASEASKLSAGARILRGP